MRLHFKLLSKTGKPGLDDSGGDCWGGVGPTVVARGNHCHYCRESGDGESTLFNAFGSDRDGRGRDPKREAGREPHLVQKDSAVQGKCADRKIEQGQGGSGSREFVLPDASHEDWISPQEEKGCITRVACRGRTVEGPGISGSGREYDQFTRSDDHFPVVYIIDGSLEVVGVNASGVVQFGGGVAGDFDTDGYAKIVRELNAALGGMSAFDGNVRDIECDLIQCYGHFRHAKMDAFKCSEVGGREWKCIPYACQGNVIGGSIGVGCCAEDKEHQHVLRSLAFDGKRLANIGQDEGTFFFRGAIKPGSDNDDIWILREAKAFIEGGLYRFRHLVNRCSKPFGGDVALDDEEPRYQNLKHTQGSIFVKNRVNKYPHISSSGGNQHQGKTVQPLRSLNYSRRKVKCRGSLYLRFAMVVFASVPLAPNLSEAAGILRSHNQGQPDSDSGGGDGYMRKLRKKATKVPEETSSLENAHLENHQPIDDFDKDVHGLSTYIAAASTDMIDFHSENITTEEMSVAPVVRGLSGDNTLGQIRTYDEKCVDVTDHSFGRVEACSEEYEYQLFYFDLSTLQIKQDGKCLDSTPGNLVATIHDCIDERRSQKWYYNIYTKQLRSLDLDHCLTGVINNNLRSLFCKEKENRRFDIPSQWSIGFVSDVPFPGRIHHNIHDSGSLCFERLYDTMYLGTCNGDFTSQDITYNPSTFELEVLGKCLHYDDTREYLQVSGCSNYGERQKWYYNEYTLQLMNFYSNKCITAKVLSDPSGIVRWILSVEDCIDYNIRQQFYLPLHWSIGDPSHWPDKVKEENRQAIRKYFTDKEVCIQSVTEENEPRVRMITHCDERNKYQKFVYDQSEQAIKQSGMCLHFDDSLSIAALRKCNGSDNQSWYYDINSGSFYIIYSGSRWCLTCLHEDLSFRTCDDADDQIFIVPQSWHMESNSTYAGDRIQMYYNMDECIETISKQYHTRVSVSSCNDTAKTYQQFFYAKYLRAIKQSGLCLTVDDANINIAALDFCSHNSINQAWYYNVYTHELNSFLSSKCLSLNEESNHTMRECDGSEDQKFIVPSNWHIDLVPFVQIQNWRVAATQDDEISRNRLSFSSNNSTTAAFFLSDGSSANDHEMHHGYSGWEHNGGTGLKLNGGVEFGDHTVQIDSHWRIRQTDMDHLSISHENGNVPRIYISDGTFSSGDPSYSGYIEDLGVEQCAFVTDKYLQIGDWRLGAVYSDSLSVTHSTGVTTGIYHMDGTYQVLRSEEKEQVRYSAWSLRSSNVIRGSPNGCRSVILMNTAPGGMKCLQVSSIDNTTSFVTCDTSKHNQQFFLRHRSPDKFILQPSQIMDHCISTNSNLEVNDCQWLDGAPLWTINKANGRIVPNGNQDYCITHDFNNDRDAKVNLCNDNYQTHVSIAPFRSLPPSVKEYSVLAPGLSSVFPHNGIQLFGREEYSNFTISGWNIPLMADTTLAFKFRIDTPADEGNFEVCVAFNFANPNPATTLPDFPFCINLLNSVHSYNIQIENDYVIRLADFMANDEDYDYMKYDVANNPGAEELVVDLVIFRQRETATDTEARSRFHSIDLYNPGTGTLVKRGSTELKMKINYPPGSNTKGLHFIPRVLIQNAYGDYDTVVSEAQKFGSPIDEAGSDFFTIKNLPPGRRFQIELDPVDQSGNAFSDDRRQLKILFEAYTSCSIQPIPPSGDHSGKPRSFKIFQSESKDDAGLISFQFTHNSECSEAYALTRQETDKGNGVNETVTFTPTYFFESTNSASGTSDVISPEGMDFKDRVAFLQVGKTYEYCVAAVAKNYMVNPELSSGALVQSSKRLCNHHTVQWEASAIVKVTLKRESGSEPVQNVTVTWKLLSPDGTEGLSVGTAVTPKNGLVHIKLKIDPVTPIGINLNQGDQLPLKIEFAKTSDGMSHTFLCNEETSICSENGHIIYLSHLDFEELVHITDATTMLVSGTVYSGYKVESNDMQHTGCTLGGVEVCLKKKGAVGSDGTIQCVKTDSFGYYELFATIGTYIYPDVEWVGHKFVPLNFETGKKDFMKENLYQEGIFVSPENVAQLSKHDFFDETTARLKVEVAGGECDIFLGKSKVQVTQENCDSSIFSQTFEQEEIRKEYEVPAHVLYVEVISLQDSLDGDREFVMNEFRDFSIRIDLTETGEESELEFVNDDENIQALSRTPTVSPSPFISTSPSPFPNPSISRDASELTENGNDKNLARFQYNGILVIKPAAIEQDRSGDCYYYKTERAGESESFHVVKTTNDFDVKVLVYQMIIPPNEDIAGHFCSIVESSTKLTIHNDVGIAPDNDILASSTKGEKERYTKCAGENPCITLVELLSESEGSPSFGVKLQLKAGLPKKEKSDSSVEPYHSKKLTITSGSSRHIMYVVITGDFPATGNDYFSVPVTKPLLVIRDPPGGLSSVAYKNVQTSIKISHNHYERYSGYDNGFESRLVVKSGASMAVPFCVGPESDLLEGDLETGIGVNLHGSTLEDFDDDTRSRSLVVEWSYSTAGENGRGLAGKDSDVFLIPTFNILFAETDVIMFDDSICEAYSSRQTKFDLTNDGNKEAISFLTYHQISTVTLPELQRQLTQVDDEVRRLSIQNSINAWNVALAEYEDTNQKAEEGELARTSGIDQFTNIINSTLDNQQARTSINPDESPTSILPKVFAENLSKNALNLSNSIIEQTTPDKIIRADHVHFSGGGNVVAMEFDDEDIVNHMSKFNGLHGNSDTSESFGVDADSSLAVGFSALFGFHVSARTYSTDDVSWRYFNENNQRKKTSIRVEFGDSDDGDEFLVGIYLDPAYGTFVFSTAAGQSKCPHEKNTLPIEDPFIAVSKMPPNIVGSDNLMVFELELGNKGYGDSTFLLYHETSDNTDGLRLDFMESSTKTWILPSTYLGGTVTKTTMTIAKGPKHSIYNPIHVYLASKCDFNGEYGNSRVSVPLYNYVVQGEAETKKYIKFTEICPAVEWANIKQFSINSSSDKSLSMTILNPSERKLSEEEFLESISLQYRKVNDPPRPWETGRGVDGAELNLKMANEDFFGYITSNWKYPRIEGFYEVRLKSSCDCDACPLHLSEFTSDSIFGTIDLTPPRVYGEPIPHGNIAPGEQLTVYFTEAIDCGQPYGFNVWIQLSESSILYDKNDLDFTCEGNSIGIVFNEDRIVGKSFDRLLGRSFTMRIAGIKDRSGNEMEEDFTFESNFVCLPPEPKIVISFDETRQYLPHEPIMFKATISNHKERWVTTTKLFVPTNARKARKKSFSPRAVDVNEETTSEEMSVEGMTFITDAPSLAPTSSSIPSLLPTELLVPSILSSSLPSKSNLLTFTPSLSSVPSINPSKVSTDKPTFAPFVPYGSTQSNGRTVLIPQDTEVGERYGCSVDLSGGTSIVGSAESAIIYRWNEGEEIWKQEAKLTIPGEESFDGFGTSVGISGDFVIIGAPNHGQSGAAFIYFWDIEDSSWKFEKKLTPLDLQEHGGFGTSVGISGNYVVVGSPYNLTNSDNSLSGTAYTYFCDSSGSWGYEQKLPVGNETVHHTFGSSVGIDGDVIAVGSPHGDNSLHVYRVKLVSGIPIWYHEAKIVSRNIDFEFEFGSTVAVSRNVIVASSPQNESQRSHHGIVYVYRWSLSNNWELDTTLTPIDSESVAKFGCSLDISDDVLLVGSCGRDEQPGSVQVFLYQPEIGSWSKQLELTARDVIDDVRELNHSFGFAVAVSEFTAIVGSPGSRFSSIFAFDNYTTVVEMRDGSSATTSYLELGLNLKTNHNGLQVLVNGEPLISNQVYTLDGDDDTNTTIALLKGPGNQLSFPPISLFLRSHCSRDSHKPVKVTADLWNWEDPETGEKIIRFTPPCPSIHWASQSKMLSGLIEGNTTLNAENSFMKVSIFNEGFMERKLFDRSIANAAATVDETPLQDVVLLYRRDGDMSSAGWIQGKLYLDRNRSSASSEDSVLVDFSTENVEDDFGYVSLFWDLSALPDGIYETKVVARCNQTSSSIATQSSSTKTVEVIVDRLPPKVYGYPDLHMPIHKHPASTEYSIDFTEEVACEWPFTFDLSLIINDGENITHVRSNDGIHIICSGRSIRYRFDRSRFNFGSLQYLLSSSITVLLKNVEDLAGNMMATEFRGKMTNDKNMAQLNREERIELSPQGQAVFGNQADFTFGTGDHVYLDDLATDCPLKIDLKTLANGLGCDGIDQNCDGVVDDCEEDIKPPTIYLLEGIEREKLPEFDGMVYLPGKCFESTFQVMSYLEKNVYAKDECASEFVYNISQVSFHDFFNKNHNYRLVEYSITAFDARCGNGPAWSAQESFLVKIFQGFDDDMKFQGCNGVDENCDGVVDDCMEDRISPLILIEDSIPPSAYSYDGNLTFIESLSFNSIQTGMEFLLKAIKAEDDCAKGLDISTSVNEVSCSNTIVTVTASDPRCSESNPIQLVSREFVLRVDNTAPMVDLGFDHDIDPDFFDPDGKVLHIRESKKSDYENIHFWYNITDDCPQSVDVEIVVSSNEFQYTVRNGIEMALIQTRKGMDRTHQQNVLVEPKMCNQIFGQTIRGCETDPNSLVRYYEISVKATDYGGNVGESIVKVIVIPRQYVRMFFNNSGKNAADAHPMFFVDLISQSTSSNVIATKEFNYEIP